MNLAGTESESGGFIIIICDWIFCFVGRIEIRYILPSLFLGIHQSIFSGPYSVAYFPTYRYQSIFFIDSSPTLHAYKTLEFVSPHPKNLQWQISMYLQTLSNPETATKRKRKIIKIRRTSANIWKYCIFLRNPRSNDQQPPECPNMKYRHIRRRPKGNHTTPQP